MYHRIADLVIDPWGLAVAPDVFHQQLIIIKETRIPLHLSAFITLLKSGSLPREAVSITFDDGYFDNLAVAKSLLKQHSVPATLFVTTGALGKEEFWWDELVRIVFGPSRTQTSVELYGGRIEIPAAAFGQEPRPNWRAGPRRGTPREITYYQLWSKLRLLPACERELILTKLRDSVPMAEPTDSRPLTYAEVSQLIADGQVELAAHSVTHPFLPHLGAEARRAELAESKAACEELSGAPITGFAYPYGAYDELCREDVQGAGFHWACTARGARAFRDVYALPRHHVPNSSGRRFRRLLRSP